MSLWLMNPHKIPAYFALDSEPEILRPTRKPALLVVRHWMAEQWRGTARFCGRVVPFFRGDRNRSAAAW